MKHFVIFDTEYTTWEGAADRDWTGPGEHREVVQIAALKIEWPSGKILDELDIVTKPRRNPVLSNFFIQLTGITQERIDMHGISFGEGMTRFLDFCGVNNIALSHGNDSMVMMETALLQDVAVTDPLFRIGFMNIKPYIRDFAPGYNVNSGRLWQYFGLEKPHEKAEHDALFDCYSILATLKHMRDKGAKLPF